MRKKITLFLALLMMTVTFAACQKESVNSKAEDPKTETAAVEEVVESDNPLVPQNTENWTDEDWENWVEDGYDQSEWDESIFHAENQDPSTDGIWNEEEWADDTWQDELLEATSEVAPPLAFSNTKPQTLSSLLTNTAATSDDAGVRAVFNAFNPGADILAVRLQGDGKIYSIYGLKGTTKYKMLIDGETNEVYLNKAISTGAPETNEILPPADPEALKGNLSSEMAEDVFKSYHPNAEILKTKLEDNGNHYYIYGMDDTNRYQMKIQVDNGGIIFHNTSHIGGGYSQLASSANTGDENPATSETQNDTAVVENTPESAGEISEADARGIFQGFYPNANILQVKLQDGGKSYYLFGQEGNSRYKMKILTHNGEVVMNRSNGSGGGNYSNTPDVPPASGENTPLQTGGAVDAAGANAIFASYYPGVSISTTELQDGGKAYYMYGESGGIHYKMKVLVHDGSVVYTNAGGNGYSGGNNYNNNSSSNNDNYNNVDSTSAATADGYSGATSNRQQNRGNNYSNRG